MPNLVGIGNSQVPTNAMLGGFAYQDSVGEIDIEKIKAKVSYTAVDIFVYDTRKDSDGGAWRHRTQSTSWYNEGASATRGARKEFPAVAVLVLKADDFIIYDGDDPNLPMWMMFKKAGNSYFSITTNSCVAALNGKIASGGNASNDRFRVIDFLLDNEREYSHSDGQHTHLNPISGRNETVGFTPYDSSLPGLVNRYINDVAMTVLPNAPIDASTGLPVPTIAVATDGGTNVINHDGTITQGYQTIATEHVDLHPDGFMIDGISGATNDSFSFYDIFKTARLYSYGHRVAVQSIVTYLNEGTGECLFEGSGNKIAIAQSLGLLRIEERIVETASDSTSFGLHNRTTSSYNTGWMAAESKGAFLSSTDTTNITGSGDGYVTGNDSTFGAVITSLNWSERSGSSGRWNVSGGTLNTGNPGPYDAGEYLDITLPNYTSGQTHVITYTLSSVSGTKPLRWRYNDGQMGNLPTSNGFHAYYVTLTETGTLFSILNDNNLVASIDNFKIQLVSDDDRSGNNKGLVAYGTVPKQPVATGAELVSYGPFSTSNRLRQYYNSDLNFETNDWSIMFWMYNTGTNSHQTLVSRDNREFDVSILANTTYNRRFRIYADQSGNTSNYLDSNDDPFPLNTWSHVCVNFTGGNTCSIYVNGVLNKSGTLNYDIDDTSNGLNIGVRNTSGSYAHAADGTKLALVRISKTAPSADQVKKIYYDEKFLYNENAQATLYGTSDAVTALAHDDSNNILHVGTSAGRSEFQGLKRINNTTTAVTTAISVSNRLVAEQ